MRLILLQPTSVLMEEIRNPRMNRAHVAQTYALALWSSEKTDWPAVNQAIMQRWSFSGLEYIKKLAWKMVDEKRRA